jgi:hypothetical protein
MDCILQSSEQEPFICINCGSFLPALYEIYGESHIRLVLCQHCNTIADKYVEYDNVLLFIDLILMKPSAYRHTIYNIFLSSSLDPGRSATLRPSTSRVSLNLPLSSNSTSKNNTITNKITSTKSIPLTPLVFRLGILMLLFEVYVTWAYQEKSFIEKADQTSIIISLVLEGPIQYIYFLSTTLLQNIILCLSLSYFGLQWLPFSETSISTLRPIINLPFPSRSPSPSPTSTSTSTSNNKLNTFHAQQLRIPKLYSLNLQSSPILSSHSNINNNINSIDQMIFSRPTFKRIFRIMVTTVLISNIIKLFPIVMLIWPYDSPILHATRLVVRIVHLLLLIEAIYIVFINPKDPKKYSYNKIISSKNQNQTQNHQTLQMKNYYYNVAAVVLISELARIIITHIVIVFFASAIWGISIREIGLDDWKMLKVGIKMLEELGEYILGEV